MKIFIVILNYNGGQDVLECLESVFQLDKKGFDLSIVVVDNASTDKSLSKVQSAKRKAQNYNVKFKVIKNKENLGFAAGNNVGIRWAKDHGADWVFLLNNDTTIDQEALALLTKAGDADLKIGILGPKIYFYPGCEFHPKRYQKKEQGKVIWYAGGVIDWQNMTGRHRGVDEVDIGQYNQIKNTDFISGCAMMIKSEVLEAIGLLDERYFLYYEDVDFCLKAKKAGYQLLFVPEAEVWHKNIRTGRTGLPYQEYYMARNRLLLGLRWAPWKTKIALLKESLMNLFKGSEAKRKGVIDFYLRKFGKGSY